MVEISLLEFGVYGFITYTGLLMLIISTIKEVPSEKSGSVFRSIWLIPSIICAFIIASSGITLEINEVHNTITNLNTTETWTETVTNAVVLQNPIWVTVHMMIFLILIVYVVLQILNLFTKIK